MDLNKPLAYRVRPKSLEEFIGQEHILGKDKLLYRTIKADYLALFCGDHQDVGKLRLQK